MIDIYLTLFIIQIIVCFIIDLSGAPEHLFKPVIRKVFNIPKSASIKITPLDCSLCSGLYTNLLYAICTGNFNIYVLLTIVLLSFFSKNITGFLIWVQTALIRLEDILYKLIK